jgi:NAD(P)-dependent dehydrogenase (short-subunit alcohol dehydrogenase family)
LESILQCTCMNDSIIATQEVSTVGGNGAGKGKVIAAGALLAGALVARGAATRQQEADLRGRVALITGGSRGLGLALSEELGSQGCRIAICARDGEELVKAAEILRSRGLEVFTALCDVTDRAQVARMLQDVTAHYGSIDILIANAGIITVAPLAALTAEDFDRVMAVNFDGVLNVALGVLPQMERQGGGHIAIISSIGGKVAVPHLLPYSCAKFAAAGFAEGLRAELAGTGITVTSVYPGLMRTGSHLQAEFGGDQAEEYDWFSLGASSPYPVATSATRAAHIIAGAIRRGDAECIFPISALLAARVSALFPAATSAILATVNTFLPSASAAPGRARFMKGAQVKAAAPNPVRDAATVLGQRAAEHLNQGV